VPQVGLTKIKMRHGFSFDMDNTPENRMLNSFMTELSNTPIDGHFWVEKDGKVIDPYFIEYDYLKKYHNGTSITYLPAPELIQKVMNGKIEKLILKHFTNYELFLNRVKFMFPKLQFGFCQINAHINHNKYGGKIVFGSWGFVKQDGSVWYEFGGKDWTVKQFLKK